MKNISPLYKFSLKAEGGTNSINRKCNPLRRSCGSSARNAGEWATCPMRAGELEDENWRLCSPTVVRGVAGELEDESCRRRSTTVYAE